MDLSVVPYVPAAAPPPAVRYRECLRNHAAAMGGHANDGCGEFMPGGDDSDMKCAACGCHRNFHRKVFFAAADEFHPPSAYLQYHHHHLHHQYQPMVVYRGVVPVASAAAADEEQREGGAGGGVGGRKRYRTKFTAEQKEKMVAFAEKLGWRIQKHDDVELEQFCLEVGVKRHVLKVWMHNNKNSLGKKDPPFITAS